MIPKIIHYCWFGGNPLPDEAIKCINSWKKFCPEYEIQEWNESNFDINSCIYTKEAYEHKKWAFVSDYVRFKVLYDKGGLYFDTDVELIKSIDDIIERGPFMGCEEGDTLAVAPGLGLAAEPGLELYKDILQYYEKQHFINENGTIDTTTVVQRITELFIQKGLENIDCPKEVDGIYIYPPDYFSPMNYWTGEINITKNTRSIHHYSMSWKSETERKKKIMERKCRRILGDKLGMVLYKLLIFPSKIKNNK